MNLNTLTDFPFSKRYYLTHPWKWIKHLCVNIHSAWMRATKGYCYSDVWNWDSWFCSITPPMLRHMADYGCGYPGEPFETPEKWHNWLQKMADNFNKIADEDYWETQANEYYEEWQALTDYHCNQHPNITITYDYNTSEEHYKRIKKLYWARAQELQNERQHLIEETFKILSKYFNYLWD